jgi:hypothetical protein
MKMSDIKCRHCGKDASQINGFLNRVNKGELPSIWECAPSCNSDLPKDVVIEMAITGIDTQQEQP